MFVNIKTNNLLNLVEQENNNNPTGGNEGGGGSNLSHERIHYIKNVPASTWDNGYYIVVVYIDGVWKNAKIVVKE